MEEFQYTAKKSPRSETGALADFGLFSKARPGFMGLDKEF
jgi:hypothetical protein